MNQIKIKIEDSTFEEIRIEDPKVFEDKKTKVKTIAYPFTFPNGDNGILSITKLVKMGWTPKNDIESIIIKYK